jgi:hypothetical protein
LGCPYKRVLLYRRSLYPRFTVYIISPSGDNTAVCPSVTRLSYGCINPGRRCMLSSIICSAVKPRTHTHIHARTHMHGRTHTRTHTQTHICMHARAHTHTDSHVYAHAHTHTHTHVPTHLHARTHTHTHTHRCSVKVLHIISVHDNCQHSQTQKKKKKCECAREICIP